MEKFEASKQILYRIRESKYGSTTLDLLVVAECRPNEVLAEFHGGPTGSHLGVNKISNKARIRFYWGGW